MKVTMAKTAIVFFMLMGLASLIVLHVYGSTGSDDYEKNLKVGFDFDYQINRMQALKTSLLRRRDLISISPSPAISVSPSPSYRVPPISLSSSRVYQVMTAYGADPTGKTDSTEALQRAINDAFKASNSGENKILMQGIIDLGGAEIYLEGGSYMISSPLQLPSSGGGNLLIHGGSLRASDDFPKDRYLIELSATSTSSFGSTNAEVDKDEQISMDEKLSLSSFTFEDITLKDLMLDSNFNGGGIAVINSVRTTIDNCYITHFTSNGILVRGGHETYIHNSFLGQRMTAGGDPNERNFTGTGINLMSNDNAVTDVVIFSAATGIMISGQANILTGVHCYNKATGWGGTGIYLRLPGLTQTRIVNSYLDYTGIVAEDPVQLHISNTFFLGDAYIVLKSIKGVIKGVNIVDNMFSGNNKGVDIIQLDQSKGVAFSNVEQIVIDRNNVQGMRLRTTVAKSWVQGNGSSWTLDFNGVLLFPDHIKHVQYTLSTNTNTDVFPNHALRNVSGNRVVVKSDVVVPASIYVTVDQSTTTTTGS